MTVLFQKRDEANQFENCSAVDQLATVLGNDKLQGLTKDFDEHCSENSNIVLWTTHMTMVESMLDFIRVERDGKRELHLQSFAAMLPWLTIDDHTNYARWGSVYLADMKDLEVAVPDVYAKFSAGNFVVKRS